MALAFVLFVSGVKAVWEDSKRHRADWATNARTTRIMCGDGAFRRVPWRSVRVGDVVMTGDEEEVPADLLCIYAALPDRVCYVQTTNLGAQLARGLQAAGDASSGLQTAGDASSAHHCMTPRAVRAPQTARRT